MSQAITLIVGLCNPGIDYDHTRHNAGAWLLEAIAQQKTISLQYEKKFWGNHATLGTPPNYCHLLLPTTFMNHSGRAIQAITNFYKIAPAQILVAHDELDLSPGTIKLKWGGGHGGHNGLRDIIEQLGTSDFYRLRIGIGHPGQREQVLNYVLGRPSVADKQKIEQAIERSTVFLPEILQGNMQHVMNTLHTREV